MNPPTVYVTTSRSPSPRSRTLVNALTLVTPLRKIIRGKKSLRLLLNEYGTESTLVVVFERFGNPAGFTFYVGGRPTQTLVFNGFSSARGLRQLVDRAGVTRIIGPNRNPKSEAALSLKEFLLSLPTAQGKLTTNVDVFEKGDREVLSLSVKGVRCVNFYFRVN
ncbi:MAG: hypothetical protein QW688_00150 [Thermoprotei archaeon]